MDMICLLCEHGPHRKAPCSACGCNQWVNTAVAAARSSIQANNLLGEIIPVLADLHELMAELHPEAVKSINKKREERRKKYEEEAAKSSGSTAEPRDPGSIEATGSETSV